MKKKHILFCSLIAAVLFFPPMLAHLPKMNFFVIVLLFLIVDPLFALGMGIAAGFDLRHFWYVPLLTVFVYWLSTGLFIAWGLDILFYVLVYLLLGAGGMLITHFIRYLYLRRKQ